MFVQLREQIRSLTHKHSQQQQQQQVQQQKRVHETLDRDDHHHLSVPMKKSSLSSISSSTSSTSSSPIMPSWMAPTPSPSSTLSSSSSNLSTSSHSLSNRSSNNSMNVDHTTPLASPSHPHTLDASDRRSSTSTATPPRHSHSHSHSDTDTDADIDLSHSDDDDDGHPTPTLNSAFAKLPTSTSSSSSSSSLDVSLSWQDCLSLVCAWLHEKWDRHYYTVEGRLLEGVSLSSSSSTSSLSVFHSSCLPPFSVASYLRRIASTTHVSAGTLLCLGVYLSRLSSNTNSATLMNDVLAAHRLLLATFVIANKFADDDDTRYNNAVLAKLGGAASVKELNELEREALRLLDFNLYANQHILQQFCQHSFNTHQQLQSLLQRTSQQQQQQQQRALLAAH